MEGFKKLVPKKCKVLRDGTVMILDAEELVPGKGSWAGPGRPVLVIHNMSLLLVGQLPDQPGSGPASAPYRLA